MTTWNKQQNRPEDPGLVWQQPVKNFSLHIWREENNSQKILICLNLVLWKRDKYGKVIRIPA